MLLGGVTCTTAQPAAPFATGPPRPMSARMVREGAVGRRKFPPLESQPRQPAVETPRAALECEVLKLRATAVKRLAAIQRLACLLETEHTRSDALHARNAMLEKRNAELEAIAARKAAEAHNEVELLRQALSTARAETALAVKLQQAAAQDKVQLRLNFDPVVVRLSSPDWCGDNQTNHDSAPTSTPVEPETVIRVKPSDVLVNEAMDPHDDELAIKVRVVCSEHAASAEPGSDALGPMDHFVTWLGSRQS